MMNNLDKTYTDLLQDILDNGVEKKDRTGTGTLSVFGRQIRHKMSDGFPLLTTKKMAWKTIVTELLWFLRGDTNIKYLVDNDCHIWDGDCYSNYNKLMKNSDWRYENRLNLNWFTRDHESEVHMMSGPAYRPLTQEEFINKIKTDDEFAKKWGDLGKIYGKQWRSWGEEKQMDLDTSTVLRVENGIEKHPYKEFISKQGIDQIANLINDLKTNPDSRRLLVSAWNPADLQDQVLPPCHYSFQVYTRELSSGERRDWIIKNRSQQMPKFFDRLGWEGNVAEVLEKFNAPTRAISLMWNQRSVDTFLGLPFNIASYGLLLEIIAKEVNMVPDKLIGNLGDVHLYSNHIEQAKEQIGSELSIEERVNLANDNDINISFKLGDYNFLEKKLDRLHIPKRIREPFPLPTLNINTEFWQTESGECGVGPLKTNLQGFEISDFVIENYQSHPTIKAPLSN